MPDTSSTSRFPEPLRSAAAPRWSHRDPVEAGNPFPPEDGRHEVWDRATCRAKATLARIDDQLNAAERMGWPADPYPARVVALAEARFDVWAERLSAVVQGPKELADYEAWLTTYVANWLPYVAETCPRIAVSDELRDRLTSRARHWIRVAEQRPAE